MPNIFKLACDALSISILPPKNTKHDWYFLYFMILEGTVVVHSTHPAQQTMIKNSNKLSRRKSGSGTRSANTTNTNTSKATALSNVGSSDARAQLQQAAPARRVRTPPVAPPMTMTKEELELKLKFDAMLSERSDALVGDIEKVQGTHCDELRHLGEKGCFKPRTLSSSVV
jgi:hypothetical protein